MVDTFLLWPDQIDHPDPEQAIPVDDDVLTRELPRVFLACLGVRSVEWANPRWVGGSTVLVGGFSGCGLTCAAAGERVSRDHRRGARG